MVWLVRIGTRVSGVAGVLLAFIAPVSICAVNVAPLKGLLENGSWNMIF